MVRGLLFTHQRLSFLIGGIAGTLTGIILLLGSIQLYFDFDRLINGSGDLNQPQYFVINKQVNMLNTLFGGQKGFDEKEISELKAIEGVMDVAPLTASHFKVSVSIANNSMEGLPGLGGYSEMFFEAVPNEFVDVNSAEWQWQEGATKIPIIIPKDYINLYNFGFAPTQNLPPITEDMVGLLPLQVTITSADGKTVYEGKVIGLSERLNTILAPQSFVDYANRKFAGVEPGTEPSNRVIIRSKGPATPQLIEYFEENGYETSEESLRNSRLNAILNFFMNLFVGLGIVIIFLSLMIFLLYSQLLISKSSYEIQTLTFIGHSPRKLIATYMKYYIPLFTAMIALGIISVYFLKIYVSARAKAEGFILQGGMDAMIPLIGLVLLLGFLAFNYLSIRKNVLRLARNR